MADDRWKYDFKKRFDVPEDVRVRAQQWTNAGGAPSNISDALENLDIELTSKQKESLYNSLDDKGKEFVDKQRKRVAEMKPGGRLQALSAERLDRDLLGHALDNEHYNAGGKYSRNRNFNYDLRSEDLFGGKRKKGVNQSLNDSLKKLRESNIADTKSEIGKQASQDVVDIGKFSREQELLQQQQSRALRAPEIPDVPDPMVEKLAKQKSLADRMRKLGMSVVKKGGPKLAALMGGPIGWGIAAASTMMDAKDAYALTEDTMNPTDEEGFARQKMLADMMRRDPYGN